ncbi:type III secretion system (T3SS) SseB-like protein [Kineococcus xinjiangensis]|uniref:Type III secretion system (T3SS) SseB-like protein n=1 Tax=Kineococcus xinjiangensis TaxID=512762 RepID=A0A2S6IM27_9ACTN|nr:SseB family protein [Kineococcus xinjiangensis]PPK95200.1 type III secretion system (T3SS) SseB-like protein [Kineococcus xinjiangensis]
MSGSSGPERRQADSAGVPWAGRTLAPNPFAGDDGSPAPAVDAALARWAAVDPVDAAARLRAAAEVVAALAGTRVFAPVVAVLGEAEVVAAGPAGDKSADMALALLTRDDGRRALPLFTGLERLAAWRADARPVPVEAARAALSGVQERCEALVLDPAGPVRFVVPRPAVEALARQGTWTPAPFDEEVASAARAAVADLPAVRSVAVEAGERAELRLVLGLVPGLDREALSAVTAQAGERLAASRVVAERASSLELRLVQA